MNIAFFIDHSYLHSNGGTELSVKLLYENLTKLGHRVAIFAPQTEDQLPPPPHVTHLPSIAVSQNPKFYMGLPFSAKLFQVLTSLQPDLVHNHSFGSIGLLGNLIGKSKNIPTIFTNHVDIHHPSYINYLKLPGSLARQTLKTYVTTFCNLHDHIICPSEKIATLLKTFNVTKPISHIANGIDIQQFSPKKAPAYLFHRKLNLAPQSIFITFVGRLEEEKQIDILISAFNAISNYLPHIYLIIAGDGSLQQSLASQSSRTLHPDRIKFLGRVPHSQLPTLLQESTLFATASTSEVHPLSVIEAIASGLPIVTTTDSAYDDLVKPNVNGLRTNQTPKGFAQAIAKIISHPHLAKRLSQASLELSKNFSIDRQCTSLLHLYQQEINLKNNPL